MARVQPRPPPVPKKEEPANERSLSDLQDDIEEMGDIYHQIAYANDSEGSLDAKLESLFDDPDDVRELIRVLGSFLDLDTKQVAKYERNLVKVDKILLK